MGRTLSDMRLNGAISAIATRYRSCRCWDKTKEWAGREFRDCSQATITACIKRARQAVNLADRMMAADPDAEFDAKVEARTQA